MIASIRRPDLRIALFILSFSPVQSVTRAELATEQAKLVLPAPKQLPVQYGQVFGGALSDPDQLAETRGMVWARNRNWNRKITGMYTLSYTTAYRICCRDSLHNLQWLYENHPDWIEYRNDRRSVAWEFSDIHYSPLDIANPDVRHFLLAQDVEHARFAQGIGLDNVRIQNSFLRAGHYANIKLVPCRIDYRPACGGTWTQQYNGVKPSDPTWRSDNLDYVIWMRTHLARYDLTTFVNLNYQAGEMHIAVNRAADGSMAEAFPQHGCETLSNHYVNGFTVDGLWQQFFQDISNDSKRWWFAVSYLCGHDTGGMSPAEESWNVANYLFFSQNPAVNYLSMGLQGSHAYNNYPASANPPIGPYSDPLPAPRTCGGAAVGLDLGLCVRKYYWDKNKKIVNGIVVVNSSGEHTLDYIPPKPAVAWTNQFCTAIGAGTLRFRPASALVILSTDRNGHCRAYLR